MNHADSGLAHGTNGSPQLTTENGDMEAKVKENEERVERIYPGNRTHEEYEDLARDPSHGNEVLPQGIKERDIGLELEKNGVLNKIIRDKQDDKGAEFIDTVTGIKWDIKSFASNPNGHKSPRKGAFKLEKAIEKIEKEFAHNHNVIIDTRDLVPSDKESLMKAIGDKGYSNRIIWYPGKGE